MVRYFLMHKDSVCGTFILDETNGHVISYKDHGTGMSPYIGHADLPRIKKWWEMRAVPASRSIVQDAIRRTGCLNSEMYLAKHLALSMTDSYWICPADAGLKYDQVRFSNFGSYNDGKIPYHNASSYDVNASLGGQMEKYWDLDHTVPNLVKESSIFYGQQSVNEVIATKIHSLQNTDVPYVRYTAEIISGHGIVSHCDAFTSERIELIPAYEIVDSRKAKNSSSLYDHYIDMCVQYGIEREAIQKFMDYQTLTDFIISNTDEHLANFGVLRDADTMKLIGPAPIYDSGNSMFYNEERTEPFTRSELLGRPLTSFYQTEDKMIAEIHDRSVVKLDLLPSPEEIKKLYLEAGVPEKKAEFIKCNYETKILMAYEFQRGRNFSLYQERNAEKQLRRGRLAPSQKLIVLCGLPGSGKTKYAMELAEAQQKEGRILSSAKPLYTVERAVIDTSFLLNRDKIMEQSEKHKGYEHASVVVSLNDIRDEIKESGFALSDRIAFLIAQARIKKALLNGANVIYDAANLTRSARMEIMELGKTAGNVQMELHVVETCGEPAREGISQERMESLNQRFQEQYPSQEEGWDRIVKHGSVLQFESEKTETTVSRNGNLVMGKQEEDLEW